MDEEDFHRSLGTRLEIILYCISYNDFADYQSEFFTLADTESFVIS